MLHIQSLTEGLELFKTLGSEIRIQIIELLIDHPDMNMNELASELNITNGALTAHIKKLEECGIISVSNDSNGHGNMKKCSVHLDKILINVGSKKEPNHVYRTELKVGQYSDYSVAPTCGLASTEHLIGEMDDVRYFSHPDHYTAELLWFRKGYVEYIIPNMIPAYQKIDQLTITAELGSEAPGINEIWPSDLHFHMNNRLLGTWISPGDFGSERGILNPDWWPTNQNQYGLLKQLTINKNGTFLDGLKISDVTITELDLNYNSTLKFRIEVPEHTEHVGGLTIFGKGFGNYNQNIDILIHYSSLE